MIQSNVTQKQDKHPLIQSFVLKAEKNKSKLKRTQSASGLRSHRSAIKKEYICKRIRKEI